MRILVFGGTGKIGRNLVANLAAAGAEAVPAARQAGAGGIDLDLADAEAVARAAHGFDAAYLMTPIGPEETAIGLAAHEALVAAGLEKIVYLAIHNLEMLRRIPHFEAKIPIKQAVLARPRAVVLEPNFFFQNDLMVRSAITGPGIYPLPVGSSGVWSIDVADIARAACRALMQDDWDGTAVPLCGSERLTGPVLAANWSAALGRPVVYAGDGIDPFIGGMRASGIRMSDWMEEDFRLMMQVTQELGCPATAQDIAASTAIIGRAPRTHAAFAAATVEETTQ